MSVPDTPFQVRARGLRSPTSADFDELVWHKAFAETGNGSIADENLFRACLWIADQSSALRSHFTVSASEHLGSRNSVILAVAAINREYRIATDLSWKATDRAYDKGGLSMDFFAAQPIDGGMPGHEGSAASFIETAVDAAESWLFDAYRAPPDSKFATNDLAPIAIVAIQKYSIQYSLNSLWNHALWEGWFLNNQDGELYWSPGDRRNATLIEAWRARSEANFMNFFWADTAVWGALPSSERYRRVPRTVVGVQPGKPRRIQVGRPACLSKRMPGILAERGGLEGSYLLQFLDEPMPFDSRLTSMLLSHAWHVIADFAQLLSKSVPDPATLNVSQACALALLVGRRELAGVLGRALKKDIDVANAIIDFLSFKPKSAGDKGHRGLWSAPLVPIPDEDRVALVLPSLMTSNALRKVEAWLEKGGLDDRQSAGSRGKDFEERFRSLSRERLAKNPLLSDARCAEQSIQKDADFSEEIDLLVQIGSILFVGEVKFHLTPADSRERYNHFRKLGAASGQARRKAALLATRPDIIARALGIEEKRARGLRVVPLIVDNQGFGSSLTVQGCRVTDSRFLLICLGGGSIVTEAVVDTKTRKQIYHSSVMYTNQIEAERNFEELLAAPPVLSHFIRRVAWGRSSFPTAAGTKLFVEVPQLGDIEGEQRKRARALTKMLDRP